LIEEAAALCDIFFIFFLAYLLGDQDLSFCGDGETESCHLLIFSTHLTVSPLLLMAVPSVRLCITLMSYAYTVRDIETHFAPYNRAMLLVS